MKLLEKHIGKFLLAIAFMATLGQTAHAAEAVPTHSSKLTSYTQDDGQKPLWVYKVTINEVSQIVSQNEYQGLGFLGLFEGFQNFQIVGKPSQYTCYFSSKDKRELIFRHLFPFHFFLKRTTMGEKKHHNKLKNQKREIREIGKI